MIIILGIADAKRDVDFSCPVLDDFNLPKEMAERAIAIIFRPGIEHGKRSRSEYTLKGFREGTWQRVTGH